MAAIYRMDGVELITPVDESPAAPAGRGIEDGLEVLDALAAHPATARHLATELAVRFVADEPPAALVDRLAGR